eukprot:TRINITY_DN14027_c0_g1_i2.p1 TRINITY_DN14027_c0_g1~~TRINITY_DN14027_c0_g1_i2.p1  ORF type:complete len:271 (-),score=38.21 TRINITY_DN14027_c0_g1_i2:170-982(-)
MLDQAWRNRANPRLVRAFQKMLQSDELAVSADRFSLMRPTNGLYGSEDWRTRDGWLHWDQNPWSGPGFQGLQGLLCLTDHTETSGGFLAVPDFIHEFARWGVANPPSTETATSLHLVPVPLDDPLRERAVKVLAPAGSLIVWDSRTPHCNYSNTDDQFRACQYVTFEPRALESGVCVEANELRMLLSSRRPEWPFPECLGLLGQKLLGLQDWEATETVEIPEVSEEQMRAWECIREAERLEQANRLDESIECYKQAKRTCRSVAEDYGIC